MRFGDKISGSKASIGKLKIGVHGLMEYRVLDRIGNIIKAGTISNAFSTWGKQQLALLCGQGLGGYPIASLRVRKGSSWSTMSVSNSMDGDTLVVDGQDTISGPGTVNLIECAGTPSGDTQYHNSIECTIVLTSDMSLDITVKIWFTGLEGHLGNRITACRLGNTGTENYPIASITFSLDGTPDTVAATCSASGNTLTVSNSLALTSTGDYTLFGCSTTNGSDYYEFSGHTITLYSGQELYVYEEFVYG